MPSFHDQVVDLFQAQHSRLYRFVNRLVGDPDLAADIVQETFVSLYRRGSLPDSPEAWLVSVALNRLRNTASTRRRRLRLLTPSRGEGALADPPRSPDEAAEAGETRDRVRRALDRVTERERALLLLHAEGYAYRDIAVALQLNDRSVGTMLARARQAFRAAYAEEFGAD